MQETTALQFFGLPPVRITFDALECSMWNNFMSDVMRRQLSQKIAWTGQGERKRKGEKKVKIPH